MIAEYLASSWPFILPPALFVAGIAVGVKWHRAHVARAERNTRGKLNREGVVQEIIRSMGDMGRPSL